MLQALLLGAALSIAQGPPGNQKVPGQLLPPEVDPTTAAKVNGDKKDANGKDDEKKDDDEKKPGDDPWRMFPKERHGFKLTGWVYGTGVYNASNGSGTRFNGPMTTNDEAGVFLNQLWLNLNRPLKDTLSWGANIDFSYGNDYINSLSRGFENANARGWLPAVNGNQDYGIVIPQAYVEFGTTKYSVKVGHFFTPHGYMVVQGPGNFFNTMPWGYMMTNPFTHWGAMGTANISDQWQLMGALVNGWDALDRPVNSVSFMGGIKYSFKEKKGFLSSNLITGQEPENLGTGYANRTLITNIFDYKFTDRVEFVFEQNVGWQENRGADTACFFNFAPYLFYKINDCWKAGIRYEFYHDPGGFTAAERVNNPNNGPIAANDVAGPYMGNFQTIALGLNWAPRSSKNLMIRPELRWDWFNGQGVGGGPFNAGKSNQQVVLMVGAYYLF